MNFGKRLARIRKEQKMTQIVLSEISGCHINMVRRYEANKVQPSLDVIRRLSVALSTSADSLVFSEDERCQQDELKMLFEAAGSLSPEEKDVAKALLESLIMRHNANRFASQQK
ncbi:helix-turn-helix domain-containing protein [Leclercia tamurae]|jgi:transcriptional regulator with XRE-family HTH domain|uniref:Helix-turn-helix transcriptional regulator n=1 Tax=Leclercia tamurae TaxID=2926467 RepID=A0ABT2R9W7_9ENTR|nr:helix-turn-helix transcriptional regulator [Leclercia tamurae]MCU6677667.1 helix-turn-helix transcriptional regulator [Leclercia tamurae]